jgi:hypothetical protein
LYDWRGGWLDLHDDDYLAIRVCEYELYSHGLHHWSGYERPLCFVSRKQIGGVYRGNNRKSNGGGG